MLLLDSDATPFSGAVNTKGILAMSALNELLNLLARGLSTCSLDVQQYVCRGQAAVLSLASMRQAVHGGRPGLLA